MPSMMSSHGVALATAVAVSGTVLLLGFCRQRSPSSAQLDALAGEEGFLSPPRSLGSLDSDAAERRTGGTASEGEEEGKKKKKRKKRVRFAEQLVVLHVQDDENGPTEEEKLFESRGCLGCCIQPSLAMSMDKPCNGLMINGIAAKRSGLSEDLWSTSTFDLEMNGLHSQRSVSSMSASLLPSDLLGDDNVNACNISDFVNHGLILWNQTREQWVERGKLDNRSLQATDSTFSWNSTYVSLIDSGRAFPRPIPLSEVVELVVDSWEEEGVYDY